MLGSAGLGKTFEMAHLADFERRRGLKVIELSVGRMATSSDALESRLTKIALDLRSKSAIYLDSLDEAMMPVRTTSNIVATWIREDLKSKRPRLRISCRSAVWPTEVEAAIREVYPEDNTRLAVLTPISDDDVRRVVKELGVDPDVFFLAVNRSGVSLLAYQPLTLQMLVRVFKDGGTLPKSRKDLFKKGIEQLAGERTERMERGTATAMPLGDLLEAAERLACFTLLSGREVIDLNDNPKADSLDRNELSGSSLGPSAIDYEVLRALRNCGLFEREGPNRFRFAHRQLAEYLAGRRIATLLPHQSKSLLGSGLGWRFGVAGPLRETAAFAAMESNDVAEWLVNYDPEVIGISDVADHRLRRRGMLEFLDRFRRHVITDVPRDSFRLDGFRYSGIEDDLQKALAERGAEAEDLLQCAFDFIRSMQLQSLSNVLAELVLDGTASIRSRKSAGYLLTSLGTRDAQYRLKPLIHLSTGDPAYDLKGIALRCLWPADITTLELFAVMNAHGSPLERGALEGFLYELDSKEFDARDHPCEGLNWARQHIRPHGNHDAVGRVIMRIAHRALSELDKPGVKDALISMLLETADVYGDSPLNPIDDSWRARHAGEKAVPNPSPLDGRADIRRSIVSELVARGVDRSRLWTVVHHTHGLVTVDDVPWMLRNAANSDWPVEQRERFVDLVRTMAWGLDFASVETWLSVRETEPLASLLPIPLAVELGSELAMNLRKEYRAMKRMNRKTRRTRVVPSPSSRIREVLELSEAKDPKFFFNLCNELTVEEFSVAYDFRRHLVITPGWKAADKNTKRRIVDSAMRFLLTETDEPERARSQPFSAILPGYFPALMLLIEAAPDRLNALSVEWWSRWAWYMLRELHPTMIDEQREPKEALLKAFYQRAPEAMRSAVTDLATSNVKGSGPLLDSLLETLCCLTADPELDRLLVSLLESGAVPESQIESVAKFVLSRDSRNALAACLRILADAAGTIQDDQVVRLALALLSERMSESLDSVLPFLCKHRDLAKRILADFAQRGQLRMPRNGTKSWQDGMKVSQAAQLLQLLIELFPYETDRVLNSGIAYAVQPNDSARELRGQVLDWLTSRVDADAVQALREIERIFKTKYPWMRRHRAAAERAYRLSKWTPIPPTSVAELLNAKTKRLIRSGLDAMEGVIEAIEQYADRLRSDLSDDLEDLWNVPKDGPPTPKAEERISGKLCQCVKDYFENYAVTADREVQVYRRKSSRKVGGAPGSEVDILARVPAPGSVSGDAIAVPIEVKISSNPDSRSALRVQLVDRYMSELATSFGIFAVVWMNATNLPKTHKPVWKNIAAATRDLEEQASDASNSFGANVQAIVFDASLPLNTQLRSDSVSRKRPRKDSSSKKKAGTAAKRAGKNKVESRARRKK
jgi:hypothetical protein